MDSRVPVVVLLVIFGAWQSLAAVTNCTAVGRFADASDTTCQNYTYCVYDDYTKQYLAYYHHCPNTSVFNPKTQQCTSPNNYACNSISFCVEEGFFKDESSIDCTSFIICVAHGGNYVGLKYTCPPGTYFDPNLGDCTFDYKCHVFCTEVGRFANPGDATCSTFFSCILAPNGTYVQVKYTCPNPSVFDPTINLCSTLYTC